MYKQTLIVLLLLTGVVNCFSQKKQSAFALFNKVEHYYTTQPNFDYNVEYRIYENAVANKIVVHYGGKIVKQGKVIYQESKSIELVDFGTYAVAVNNQEKTIQVKKTTGQHLPIALQFYLKVLKKNKVTENETYWLCELAPEKGDACQYSKILFYINKIDYSLYKQEMYIKGIQDFGNKKLKNPKMEVVFTKNQPNNTSTALTQSSNYFEIINKKITLSKRLKAYKLITL
jgi:hypothetical protein